MPKTNYYVIIRYRNPSATLRVKYYETDLSSVLVRLSLGDNRDVQFVKIEEVK